MNIALAASKLTDTKKTYKLSDVFGCQEVPPADCPTYLIRDVHTRFQYEIENRNIIIVYGESKQGKTWTIERYAPEQLRISCMAQYTLNDLKRMMLKKVGAQLYPIEKKEVDEYSANGNASVNLGQENKSNAGLSTSAGIKHTTEHTAQVPSIDISDDDAVLNEIESKLGERCFVIDNFHYLSTDVQQQFCSLLKECNHSSIKIIIIGIWKDAAKITALAPDLLNRCAHIDIGSWTEQELLSVASDGEDALQIRINENTKKQFIAYSANNIGIFKDFLSRFCMKNNVYETHHEYRKLMDDSFINSAAKDVVSEMMSPLRDRITNLAKPQKRKKNHKGMRLKIVASILSLICETESELTRSGIPLETLQTRVHTLCKEWGVHDIPDNNLTQELGVIHKRSENRGIKNNFLSLFYFDKVNKKLLVLEPSLYVIKAYDVTLLEKIVLELKEYLLADNSNDSK